MERMQPLLYDQSSSLKPHTIREEKSPKGVITLKIVAAEGMQC